MAFCTLTTWCHWFVIVCCLLFTEPVKNRMSGGVSRELCFSIWYKQPSSSVVKGFPCCSLSWLIKSSTSFIFWAQCDLCLGALPSCPSERDHFLNDEGSAPSTVSLKHHNDVSCGQDTYLVGLYLVPTNAVYPWGHAQVQQNLCFQLESQMPLINFSLGC